MKKFLIILLAGLVLLLGLGMSTSQGLRLLITTASWILPGEIQISTITGSLIGPLDMQEVRYRDAAVSVQVDSLEMDWRPSALFGTRLHVRHARADGIDIQVLAPPAEQAGEPFSLRSLLAAIEIEDLTLSNISVLGFGATQAILVDRMHLVAVGNDAALQLQAFSLEAPLFSVQLEGLVSLETQQQSDVATNWWVQLPELPRLVGTGTLQGDVHTLQIQQEITGPASVVLRGTVKDILERLSWDATVDISGFDLQLLQPEGPQRLLGGSLTSSGGLDAFSIKGNVALSDPSLGAINADVQLSRTPELWRLEHLDLTSPQQPGKLGINGEYAAGGEISARAQWSDLTWQLAEQQTLRSASGELELQGLLEDYRIQGSALLESTGYPLLTLKAQGTGNLQRLELSQLQGVSSEASFDTSGVVAWQPALEWQLRANVSEFNPAFFVPGRTGKLSFRLESDGSQQGQVLEGRLLVDDVAGTLQGNPVSGKTNASFSGNSLTLTDAHFAVGTTRVSASGSLDADWKMQWDLTTQDLGLLLPGAKGILQGQGSLSGPRDKPRIAARLDGSKVFLQDINLQSLQANVDVDLADQYVSKIDIRADGISTRGQAIDRLTVSADGKQSRHALAFALHQDKRQLVGNIAAKLEGQAWSGTLEDLRVQASEAQIWTLQQPARFVVERTGGSVNDLCMAQAEARLCGKGDWSAATWTAALDGEQLPLALLKPWLEQDIDIDSMVSVQLRGGSGARGMQGTANLVLAPGSITLDDGEETLALAQFGQGTVSTRLQDNVLSGELDLPLQDNGGITGQLRLGNVVSGKGWFAPQTSVAANFKLHFVDTGLISVFVPDISTSKGLVDGDLAVSGTLGKPLFNGTAALKNAEVSLPQLGLQLTDTNLLITGDGNTLALQGSVTSAGGVAAIAGQVVIAPGAPLSMDMTITGDKVQLVNLPEVLLYASPDLKLALRQQRLDITGTVRVPDAQIQLRELKGVAKESSDLVPVEQEGVPAPAEKFKVHSRVTLVLEDKVSFSGFGLNGNINGKLDILEDPGKPTRGQGELNIKDGSYKLYGQKLDIEKGLLVFAGGPIDNPGLNMRIIRKSGDVTAGVRVTGTATTPKLDLFSDPAMEQSDMLSYLLLGVPTNNASGAQGAALSSAAASLGLTGGDMLASKLGDTFGIEDVHIESGDTLEESSLVLGKYLSPRMYISYAVGLFDQTNTFRLRYSLSKRWSVQTEAGAASGADLLYSLEND